MKYALLALLASMLFVVGVAAQENLLPLDEGITHKTYYTLADFGGCHEKKSDCFAELIVALEKQALHRPYTTIELKYDEYSHYLIKKEKPQNIIIYIHGLWGSSDQYEQVNTNIPSYTYAENMSSILLTLPGHYSHNDDIRKRDKKVAKKVSYLDWIRAVDETVLLASKLADNVIIAGQSTGGLLAIIAAHRHPAIVKKLILTEPALQVKGHLKTASCELSGVLSVFNNIAGKPIDGKLSLGCQVARLGKSFLKEFEGQDADERIRMMAQTVKVPVLLLNNEKDGVVEASANRLFYDNLNVEKKYVALDFLIEGLKHGTSEYLMPYTISREIYQFVK